ncbi:hypothetical protein ACOCEA_10045 [Maribacter sp. CXY002]|uniref:hypothetical protein n=1 Tax=Maribacter luteocoastalis TaxID=3407671 RepID=UPI003B674600
MVDKLFKDWDLETWANVLEVIGFVITVVSLIVALFVKSELSKLKSSYIFDNRVKHHSKALKNTVSTLNKYFDEYDSNHDLIKTELRVCISELEDLITKLGFWESIKCRRLVYFIKRRLTKPFENRTKKGHPLKELIKRYPKRLYTTTYYDNYHIYSGIYGIIRQIENIKKNKDKSL